MMYSVEEVVSPLPLDCPPKNAIRANHSPAYRAAVTGNKNIDFKVPIQRDIMKNSHQKNTYQLALSLFDNISGILSFFDKSPHLKKNGIKYYDGSILEHHGKSIKKEEDGHINLWVFYSGEESLKNSFSLINLDKEEENDIYNEL